MAYEHQLKDSYVVKNLRKFKKAQHFLSSERVFSIYPPSICELAKELLTVDSEQKKKVWELLRDVSREKESTLQAIKDLMTMGLSI